MSDNKSYRIKANIKNDSVLNVNLNQDFNILEVLSLKIGTESLYKYHTSDYGCVAGRVLANEGFGIPNAKISIFISATTEDLEDNIVSYLYPYTTTFTKNEDKIRYNLLPDEQLSDCHRNVGTFPNKRLVLDDDNVLEVFDKYYKFTTRTNNAGDYIIFGVPVGNQTIHVDIDLSDIGILSQSPRDMIYKGYNITQFENANMFKKSTDLDNLTQIITQNQNVYVYPFWGEESESTIAISRKDIDIQYQFTPTCVFMGSLVTDERSNGISKRCIPSERMGKMDKLTTGKGTIEMIRKKTDGSVEEFIVQGNQLVDGNGVWCYQIPMNLDYVRTDEYGNIVPTDDETKGIPTRTRVRFRISLTEFEDTNAYSHLAKVLVPNNPTSKDGYDYVFGTNTQEDSFKDLFWNNVYTVKSYIPRIQMLNLDRNKRFSGFKAVNVNNSNNPIPYNNMRVDLTFMFSLQCAIFKILLWWTGFANRFFHTLGNLGSSGNLNNGQCMYIGDGYCPSMEGWYFAPNCEDCDGNKTKFFNNTFEALQTGDSGNIDESSIEDTNSEATNVCLTRNITYFKQCVELTLAMEYDVIQFDFYNDWINGVIYMPRWFADARQKRKYLFGLITVRPRINACMENAYNGIFARRFTQQCALEYSLDSNSNFTKVETPKGCKNDEKQKCHKAKGRKFIKIFRDTYPGGGMVHDEKLSTNEYAYYFRPCEWISRGEQYIKCNLFATDIVLLGSLNSNNEQGIPQTFKKLAATSYQMPDPLASTNLGEEGYVYGNSEGTLCTENKLYGDEGIERKEPIFESVTQWAKGQDFEEDDPYDLNRGYGEEIEYAVTETAGIDWGYTGPNQKVDGITGNSIEALYFPGGHFLGISCFNTETNIKSCVNLSRICEMGSIMSQRQSIIKRGENGNWTYSYLVPTGLISGDEINDYGFKNEFATLNYNGLKTKLNKDTNLLEYDFETINPINFNGELNGKIGDEYNDLYGFLDDETAKNEKNMAYRRTIEENSKDYYNFRFNLHKDESGEISETKKRLKYLLENDEGHVSLPMYENSFYFYFGLSQGNTALDNFYKDFFAECPSLKEYEPSVKVSAEPTEYCENNGEITIIVKKVNEPYYRLNEDNVDIIDETTVITGLSSGTYNLHVGGSNLDEEMSFILTISKMKHPAVNAIEFETENYQSELEDFEEEEGENGYIAFTKDIFEGETGKTVGAIMVHTESLLKNGKPCAKVIFNNNSFRQIVIKNKIQADYSILFSSFTDSSIQTISAWTGNRDYSITLYLCCGIDKGIFKENIKKVTITMPLGTNIIFNDYTNASYRGIIRPLIKRYGDTDSKKAEIYKKWYDIVLNENTIYSTMRYYLINEKYGEEEFKNIVLNVEEALFYKGSQALKSEASGKIKYRIISKSLPYTLALDGTGEKWNNNYLLLDNNKSEGYSLSMDNFVAPTQDAPYEDAYLYDYIRNEKKNDYGIRISNSDDPVPFDPFQRLIIPSIYRPFFFRALYVSDYGTQLEELSMAVANGVTDSKYVEEKSGVCHYIKISENNRLSNFEIYRNLGEEDYNGNISLNYEENYPTATINIVMDINLENSYSITVSDKFDTISSYIDISLIGGNGRYDNRVKYYHTTTRDFQRLLSATTYNFNNRIQYNEAYWGNLVDDKDKPVIWNDALSAYIRYKYDEIPEADIVNRYVSYPIDSWVIGIYDSNLDTSLYKPEIVEDTEGNITIRSKQREPRHENSISLIRLYDGDDFKNLVAKL